LLTVAPVYPRSHTVYRHRSLIFAGRPAISIGRGVDWRQTRPVRARRPSLPAIQQRFVLRPSRAACSPPSVSSRASGVELGLLLLEQQPAGSKQKPPLQHVGRASSRAGERVHWIHRSRTRARERGRVTANLMEISAACGYGRRRSAESRVEQSRAEARRSAAQGLARSPCRASARPAGSFCRARQRQPPPAPSGLSLAGAELADGVNE
jgi:hypothetical protein